MMSVFALGRMRVRRSGYGAMQLAGQFAAGTPPDRDSAVSVLRAAVAAGVDHIDTAQYYGPGTVNALIRDALYPYPEGLAIVSKVAPGRDDSGAGDLRAGIEDNLRGLRIAQLAAVNLRLPGDGRVDARFDDQLAAMVAARDEGLIAGIGLSNISLEQLRHAALGTEIVCVQNLFHLADRTAAPLLDDVPSPWHRVRAVLPARLAARPGQPRADQPRGGPDSCSPRHHAGPGRTPVAVAAGPQRAAHPGHRLGRPPAREPGRRKRHAR